MGSVVPTLDRPDELLPLCHQLVAVGARFDAIVIRSGNFLHCFVESGASGFESMTLQVGFEEQPMRFEASPTIFVQRCLPTIISKLGPLAAPHIAFIDTDFSWSHETLLRDWAQSQEMVRGYRRGSSISIQTYLSIPDEPLVPDSQAVRNAARETEETRTAATVPAPQRCHVMEVSETRNVTAIRPGSEAVSAASLDDVPAEFDQIVWKVFTPARRNGNVVRGWDAMVADGRCFTTRELAARLHPNPSWRQLVSIFRELRREEGGLVQVPMVGFESEWLFTNGHLGPWSASESVSLSDEEFTGFRRQRYKSFRIGVQKDSHVLAAARRCLKSTGQGLLLFDLAEDVICDLTGRADVRLSLGDVCRLCDQLRGQARTA